MGQVSVVRFGVAGMALAVLGMACVPDDGSSLTQDQGDAGSVVDAGDAGDAGGLSDAGDAGRDAGANDAGPTVDAGDAGGPADAGHDAGVEDAGSVPDAGDAGARPDAGADAGPDAGADAGADAGPADAGIVLTYGLPLTADAGTWTFIPFPDSYCNDGSTVGIGINPSSTGSSNVVMYFNGGGACWDYLTCITLMSATLGPYDGGAALLADTASTGSVLDRGDALNPFNDWNYVYVPYCTGDVHAGDNVATYSDGISSQSFYHMGHANVMAYLARVAPTFPNPGKVLIAGDSAGGAGAVINYPYARAYWPHAEMYLIDDSLLFYPPSEYPAATMASELANWGIGPTLAQICGSSVCVSDFSQIYPAVRQSFPNDRMAVLSYEQDETMSAYYETLPLLYQVYLDQLATQVLQPAGIETFLLNGTGHTFLWDWASADTDAGVNLEAWITTMVTDGGPWVSEGP